MFDPNKPANNTDLDAGEMRSQLQALYLMAMPIGGVVSWCKNLSGVPPLPENFVECNGQMLSDGASPLDGQVIPNLNGSGHFLRGAATSGGTGGSATHTHQVDLTGASAGDPMSSGGNTVPGNVYTTAAAETLPPYYEVVWVMRVK